MPEIKRVSFCKCYVIDFIFILLRQDLELQWINTQYSYPIKRRKYLGNIKPFKRNHLAHKENKKKKKGRKMKDQNKKKG